MVGEQTTGRLMMSPCSRLACLGEYSGERGLLARGRPSRTTRLGYGPLLGMIFKDDSRN